MAGASPDATVSVPVVSRPRPGNRLLWRRVVVLVAALSAANGLMTVALSRLFAAQAPWPEPGRWIGQAGLDALLAPVVIPLMAAIVQRLSEEDRRAVELAPRRREA